MTKEKKIEVISELKSKFTQYEFFYLTDTSALNASEITGFRRLCFEQGIEYKIFKNTLISKALADLAGDYVDFNDKVLKGTSGILFSTVANAPGKLIKEFKNTKVVFKGASIDSAVYIGADQLDSLASLKSKNELIGDIIGLLQSPAKNVISALLSGEQKLAGIVKTLADKK